MRAEKSRTECNRKSQTRDALTHGFVVAATQSQPIKHMNPWKYKTRFVTQRAPSFLPYFHQYMPGSHRNRCLCTMRE